LTSSAPTMPTMISGDDPPIRYHFDSQLIDDWTPYRPCFGARRQKKERCFRILVPHIRCQFDAIACFDRDCNRRPHCFCLTDCRCCGRTLSYGTRLRLPYMSASEAENSVFECALWVKMSRATHFVGTAALPQ